MSGGILVYEKGLNDVVAGGYGRAEEARTYSVRGKGDQLQSQLRKDSPA